MPDRPNILLIMSDEHDAANMGCYGDPLGATPTLDGLADRGITFDAAYCNSPLCVPSRLSFTAGQYISRCGAWQNTCWLPSDDYPSLPHVLNAAGYESYLIGKQHYDPERSYGFTEVLPRMRGDGQVKKGHGQRREPDDESVFEKSWKDRSAEFYPANHGGVLDHDRAVTAGTLGFLSGRKNADPPFFCFAGYLAPHFPMIVPQQYADMFEGKVPPPEIPDGLLESLPTNYVQHRRGFGTVDTDPQVVQRGRDLYWALTRWFDDEVEKVLTGLGNSDVADNTIVIYTSDHGENKGDHGLWWKNCLYDHGARVPLIVSWPKRWAGGQRRTGVCSLVDLVQTIIELGEGEPDPGMDGDSLLGYLDDAEHPWKDQALSEYYGHNTCSGITMLRRGKFKYVYHSRINDSFGPETQLFDMHADPKELNNLADDPAHADVVAELHQAMLDELGEHPDAIEQRCRADLAKGYGRGEQRGW
jgi:choline-sulfatase